MHDRLAACSDSSLRFLRALPRDLQNEAPIADISCRAAGIVCEPLVVDVVWVSGFRHDWTEQCVRNASHCQQRSHVRLHGFECDGPGRIASRADISA
jgi:hypothetical protein